MSSNYLPEDVEVVDSKATESIQFIDIVLLRGIIDLTTKNKKSPSGDALKLYVNQFLSDYQITEARATPIGTNYKLQGHVEKLRKFGLIVDSEGIKTPYEVTEKAEKLLRNIPKDNPLSWPVVIPVEKGKIVLKRAVYINS